MTDRDRRISDQLVRLVQIVFGLVLAQGFVLHRDIILHPLAARNWVPGLALATVYITTVLSWIDWHVTMEIRPYNFNARNRYRATEQLRLDMLVVTIYAYLLFALEEFKENPSEGVSAYLLGFAAVFATYLLSGLTRRHAHGKLASNPLPIASFGSAYVLLWLTHRATYSCPISSLMQLGPFPLIDFAAIAAALGLMIAYRVTRRKLVKRRAERRRSGLVVGIDVDGVLGNQIHGVLPRVRARLGKPLRYEDVTEWRLPLGNSDIAKEIAIALEDPDYILNMPLHEGVREAVDELYAENRVIMLTGRPAATKLWTDQWLQNCGFSFDEMVNVKEENKSFYQSDVLVDDYIGNVKEYLENTNGVAILVDQPWNRRERDELEKWIREKRLHIVGSMREVTSIIKELRRKRSTDGR
jgi:5'(3')-deoxyribonucleotidase